MHKKSLRLSQRIFKAPPTQCFAAALMSFVFVASLLGAAPSDFSASSLPPGKMDYSFCDALKTPEFKKCLQYYSKIKFSPIGVPYAEVEYHLPKYLMESIPHSEGSPSFLKGRGVATFGLEKHSKTLKGGMQTGDLGTYSFNSRVMTIPGGSASLFLSCSAKHPDSLVPMLKASSEKIEKHWREGHGDKFYQDIMLKVAKPFIEKPELCFATSASMAALSQLEAESSVNVKKYAHEARDSLEWYNDALAMAGRFFPPFKVPEELQKKLFLLSPVPPYLVPCSAWGFNYPRSGTYYGSSEVIGSVSSAMKMRNLGTTVFKTIPVNSDEKIQMVYPRESGCFTEGKPIPFLEENPLTRLAELVTGGYSKKLTGTVISNERGGVSHSKAGQQYVLWHKIKCKTDVFRASFDRALIEGVLEPICKGLKVAEDTALEAATADLLKPIKN